MWRVLSLWASASRKVAVDRLLTTWLEGFKPRARADELEFKGPHLGGGISLHTSLGWLIGMPLARYNPQVVPVTTLSLGEASGGVISEARFRVALLSPRACEPTIAAQGWRFESPEAHLAPSGGESTDPPAHPYCHAQAITGWIRETPCLIHPPHAEYEVCDGIDASGDEHVDGDRLNSLSATLSTHPAFPLAARTLTGLAASVVATLYGARTTKGLLQPDQTLSRVEGAIRMDLEALVGN